MNWKTLLTAERLGKGDKKNKVPERTPFQIDYDRIVFSSAFRRLQDKTQVIPLAETDYVRTRLTHSLEVSCIARSLGIRIGIELCRRHKLDNLHPSDFGTILATAALAHDLGNPPFGHSGEQAIRHWYRSSPAMKNFKSSLSKKEALDIENFDGNAQGFRLLTRLQMPENNGGMQLTLASLGAFVKYPVEASLINGKGDVRAKKFNFFQSEKQFMKEIAEGTGLIRKSNRQFSWCRHPLVFLLEASDDISYRIVDFEDGYRLGLVSYDEITSLFLGIIGPDKAGKSLSSFDSKNNAVEFLRAKAIQKLIDEVCVCFLDTEKTLLNGKLDNSLISLIPSYKMLKDLKQRAFEEVYSNINVVEIEAAGFEVAAGLLELFVSAALENEFSSGKPSAKAKKIMQIIPKQFHPGLKSSVYEIVQKMIDYYSGMTDSHAVSVYKMVKGISLPGQ